MRVIDRGPMSDIEKDVLESVGVTGSQMVRAWFPDATDEFSGWLLWNMTPWPMIGWRETADHIARMVSDGPRCGVPGERGNCRRRVKAWGDECYLHPQDNT